VGHAADLSLERRVQLAVISHIRHTKTAYDELLRMKVPWKQARMVVEPRTLEVMKEWRGEDNTSELEDIFKEIIVIDDDDDDEGDCGSSSDDDDIDKERESSLEVVSYQAGPQELQEREPERYRWDDHPSARVPGQTYVLAPRPRHAGPRRALGPSARAPQEYSRHPAESYQPSPLHQQPPPTIRSNVGQTSLRDGGARSLNAQIHYRPTYRPEPHYVAATALRSAPTPHSPQMATQPGSFRQDPTEVGRLVIQDVARAVKATLSEGCVWLTVHRDLP